MQNERINIMKNPQELRESILDLLKKQNISANKMLTECGYNTSLVNDLRKGQMPSADKIANIAKYLGVSTDFLLGNEDIPVSDENLNDFNSEYDLITNLRQAFYGNSSHKLSEEDKNNIVMLAETILKLKLNKNQEAENKNNIV
jgi:transcriptional regulator with XRE-family HTH domain